MCECDKGECPTKAKVLKEIKIKTICAFGVESFIKQTEAFLNEKGLRLNDFRIILDPDCQTCSTWCIFYECEKEERFYEVG